MSVRAIIVVATGLALVQQGWAQERFEDPKALVSAIYAQYRPGAPAGDPTRYYSQRLLAVHEQALENQVFADEAAMTGVQFAAPATFNPFLPDASALLFDLVIGEPVQIDDRALVGVSYHNFDHPRLLSIALVREGESWKVDDVASLGDEEHWLLSWALTYDPLGF